MKTLLKSPRSYSINFDILSERLVSKMDITAVKSSDLGKLLPELIQQITEFLPLPLAAIFSLCCKQIQDILGDEYIDALRHCQNDNKREPYEFLLLLFDRERPESHYLLLLQKAP